MSIKYKNMTCTCERCNQKRVIDCLFVKVDVNLHIVRQTQLFLKINSLSPGTMVERCWESSSEEELFLTHASQHLLLSRIHMMVSTYCQSLQFIWFCVVVCNPML